MKIQPQLAVKQRSLDRRSRLKSLESTGAAALVPFGQDSSTEVITVNRLSIANPALA